jgi:hypothetical protein
MYKKLKRFLFVPLTALLCTIAISYAQADSGHDFSSQSGNQAWFDVFGSGSVMPEPLLLGNNDEGGGEYNDRDDRGENEHGTNKFYVCHALPSGKFITQRLPKKTALKLIEEHPHEWILSKCDDVISPS